MDIQTIERTDIVIWWEAALYSVNKGRERERKKKIERGLEKKEKEKKR